MHDRACSGSSATVGSYCRGNHKGKLSGGSYIEDDATGKPCALHSGLCHRSQYRRSQRLAIVVFKWGINQHAQSRPDSPVIYDRNVVSR
jgi:hypothetical protein